MNLFQELIILIAKLQKTKNFANDFNKIKNCMDLTIQEIKKRFPDTKIFEVIFLIKQLNNLIKYFILKN